MANKISLEIPDDSSLEAGYIVKYDGADWVTSAPVSISEETSNYILATGDAGKTIEMNVASANSVTVPPESSVDFPVGTEVFITQTGAGLTSLVAGAGVTINSLSGLDLSGQWSSGRLIKRGSDIWVFVTGGVAASVPNIGDHVIGGYLDSDGVDEIVDYGNIAGLQLQNTDTFSVSFWCNPVTISDFSRSYSVFSFGSTAGGWFARQYVSQMAFGFIDSSSGLRLYSTGSGALTAGTWTHFLIVWRGGLAPRIYKDGSLVSSSIIGTGFSGPVSYTTANARIGTFPSGGTSTSWYGFLGDIAVWSTDVSADAVQISCSRLNLMNTSNPPDLFYTPLSCFGDNPDGTSGGIKELVASNDGTGVNMEASDSKGNTIDSLFIYTVDSTGTVP